MVKNSCTLKIRGGVERDSYGKKAGKGCLVQWERSATLGVTQDQYLFVWNEDEPVVLASNQNDAKITRSGVCPTLTASMGMGGGYVPMIVDDGRDWGRKSSRENNDE